MAIKRATKTIPNVYELFYDSNGDLLQSPDTISFKAQANYANALVINLEDGIEDDSIVLINFKPNNDVIDYVTHWFYVRPLKNVREQIILGESSPRIFTSYIFEVPRIVLNNFSKNTTIVNEITIVKRYGLHSVGTFNNYAELINQYPSNVDLYENNGFAYVLNDDVNGNNKGYYQVIQDELSNYKWVLRDNVMNYGLQQKQYEVKDAFTERGYANIDNVPTIEGTIIEALWRDLSTIFNKIDGLEEFYNLTFNPIDSDTIDMTINKATFTEFNVEAEVKVDANNNKLLNKTSNGLYVGHDITKVDETTFDEYKELVNEKFDEKQSKLIEGDGIKINQETNVISVIGGSNGYEPDMVTINLNSNDELELNIEYIEDGGFL